MVGVHLNHIGNLKGPKGDKGDKGDTGTFASASAVSVPAEQSASVTMSGPETARHVAFEIPRGLPGVNAVANDTATAGYLAATDSATHAEAVALADGRIDSFMAAQRSHQVVGLFMGDSFTNNATGFPISESYTARSFIGWAKYRARALFTAVNRGVGGDHLPGMRDRLAADLTTYNPGFVHILGGINDPRQGQTLAASIQALDEMVEMVRERNIPLIIGTITGRNDSPTQAELDYYDALNRHIRGIRFPNVHVADYHAAFVDLSTSQGVDPAMVHDGLHPSARGHFAMGRILATILTKIFPVNEYLPARVGGEGNLLTNSRFLDGTVGENIPPTGWNQLSGAVTYSRQARTDVKGSWLVVDKAGDGTTPLQLASPYISLATIGAAVGSKIEVGVEREFSGGNPAATATGVDGIYVQWADNANASLGTVVYMAQGSNHPDFTPRDSISGVMTLLATVPANATQVRLIIQAFYSGQYRFDRAMLRLAQ